MTRQKDLKRLVRNRMQKTGEAYTTARAHITRKAARKHVRTSAATKVDYAQLAGMSDDKVKAATGCTWERWMKALDYYGADTMTHRDIAKLVKAKYHTPDWWAQTVTVGYERIKGLRARGQRRDGSYEANKSRTYHVPLATLYDAWAEARVRRRWLEETGASVRTATPHKSMRLGFRDGSIVVVGFTAKGTGKSSVAVQHPKLPDRATADQVKQLWHDRLDALGELLANK